MKQQIRLSDHFTYTRLLRFILPSVGMMIFTSVYMVVDGFFVSNFAGKTPFAAVNLIMPLIMIFSTVGFIFGTGGSAIVAWLFGQGEREKGNSAFSLFTYVSAGLGVILSATGILFLRPMAQALGAEGEMLENACLYARIILLALPFNILQVYFQTFFITAEKPKLGFAVTLSSGLVNMLLDAVLVILLPQEYKLAGAALATAVSQLVGGIVPLFYFARKNGSMLRLGKTKLDIKMLLYACINGSSEFMTNVAMSVVGMLYNIQLLKYAGENGVAAYGVMMYVGWFFSAAFFGYSIGAAPVIGFHYGAEHYSELKSLLKKSLKLLGLFGLAMTVFAQLLAVPLTNLFVGYDAELAQLTVSGFRIYAFSFAFMGYAIFASGFFTALCDGVTSATISFLRTFVFQCVAVMLLPQIWQIDGVWISIVVAEVVAVMISGLFLVAKKTKYGY